MSSQIQCGEDGVKGLNYIQQLIVLKMILQELMS